MHDARRGLASWAALHRGQKCKTHSNRMRESEAASQLLPKERETVD